jgi:hypothetical protein
MNKFCMTAFAAALAMAETWAGPALAGADPDGDARPVLRQAILGSRPAPARTEIQLGAFRDQATATQGWNKIAAQLGSPLDGLTPHIVPVDLPGKGRFWRVRLIFREAADAKAVCAMLKTRGIACLLARD